MSKKTLIIILFLLPLVLRLAYILQIQGNIMADTLIVDEFSYDSWAVDIASGNWMGREVFYQAPLYPYFLALVYTVFGHSIFAVRFIQAVLGSISCVLLFLIGEELFNRKAGVIASLIGAFYGVLIFHEGLILKESIVIFISNVLLLLLVRNRKAPRISGWLLAGLCLGLIALLRENLLLYLPFIVFWIFMTFRREWVGYSLVFVSGLILAVFPAALRNYMVGKDFVLTTSQAGTNFYIGNNPAATGFYVPLVDGRQTPEYEREDAFRIAMKESGRELKPSQVSGFWFRKAFDFIRKNPVRFVKLTVKKFLIFCNGREIYDSVDFYFFRMRHWILKVAFIGFGLMFALGIIGMVLVYRKWRKYSLLYFLGMGGLVSVVPFYVFSRYRLPVLPVLMLFGANALYELWEKLKEKNYRFIGIFSLSFLIIYPVTRIKLIGTDFGSSYYNEGLSYRNRKLYDSAISDFTKTIGLHPENPAAYVERGLCYSGKELYDKAISDYDKAVSLNPRNADAYNYRGFAYGKAGFFEQAIADFTKALELDPMNSEAHNNAQIFREEKEKWEKTIKSSPEREKIYNSRGLAYYRKGLYERAIADYDRALSINPRYSEAYNNRGAVYWKKGLYDEAIADFERTIELNPKNPEAYSNRGTVYGMKGMYEKAVSDFTKAIELNPQNPQTYINRSITYRTMGRRELAEKDALKAKSLLSGK